MGGETWEEELSGTPGTHSPLIPAIILPAPEQNDTTHRGKGCQVGIKAARIPKGQAGERAVGKSELGLWVDPTLPQFWQIRS